MPIDPLNPIITPVTPTGETIAPTAGNMDAVIATARQCVGGPYLEYNSGGDGRTNQTVADVLANGESCTGLWIFAMLQNSIDPPFAGTYDAADYLAANGEEFDISKTYPIGTFLVSTSGTEGHMAVVSQDNNIILDATHNRGIDEGMTIADVYGMGDGMDFQYAGMFEGLSASGADTGGLAGWIADLAEAIAEGVAKALIRFIRGFYALTILWPFDFVSGFYWELTRRFLGYWLSSAIQQADIMGILKGDPDAQRPDLSGLEIGGGDPFSDENKGRFFVLLTGVLTYQLAFGSNRSGTPHVDSMFGGLNNLTNQGAKGYDEQADADVTTSRKASEPKSTRGFVGGPHILQDEIGDEEDKDGATRRYQSRNLGRTRPDKSRQRSEADGEKRRQRPYQATASTTRNARPDKRRANTGRDGLRPAQAPEERRYQKPRTRKSRG